jgi:hypothetical protein
MTLLAVLHLLQAIPTGVLWGYFAFMAVESLPGSQLWERTLLLATDPKRRGLVLLQEHAAYLQVRAGVAGCSPGVWNHHLVRLIHMAFCVACTATERCVVMVLALSRLPRPAHNPMFAAASSF